MILKRSNINSQILKRNQFSKKNNTKSSLNVTFVAPRLGFEASTLEMVKFNTCNGKICMLFYTRAQVRNFLWSLEGQI